MWIELERFGKYSGEWFYEWIATVGNVGSLSVGFFSNTLSFYLSCICSAVFLSTLFSKKILFQQEHFPRTVISLTISLCGVFIALFSVSLWMTLLGVFLSFFSSAAMFLGGAEEKPEALSRYISRGMPAIILIVIGAAVFLGAGGGLSWVGEKVNVFFSGDALGLFLMGAGLLFFVLSYPIIKFDDSPKDENIVVHAVLVWLFPGVVVFSVFLHLEGAFSSTGFFPVIGWISLFIGGVLSVTGLFRRDTVGVCNRLIASGFTLCLSALAFSGKENGTLIFLGWLHSSFLVSWLNSHLNEEKKKKNNVLFGLLVFLSVFSFWGVPGFLSYDGFTGVFGNLYNSLNRLIPFEISLFVYLFLAGKYFWLCRSKNLSASLTWLRLIVFFVFIVGALAIFWTGQIMGISFPLKEITLWPHILGKDFSIETVRSNYQMEAHVVQVPLFLLMLIATYWMGRRTENNEDRWGGLRSRLGFAEKIITHTIRPCLVVFIFGFRLVKYMVRNEERVTATLWATLLPNHIKNLLFKISKKTVGFDRFVLNKISQIVFYPASIGVYLVRALHNQNLQWYLFFSFGSAVLFLLIFIK